MSEIELEEAMEALSRELGQWREGRSHPGGRTPERFWTRAVELAQQTNPRQVCERTGLPISGLQRRLNGESRALAKKAEPKPTFVEYLVGVPGSPDGTCGGCTIKVEALSGARMQVEIGEMAPSGLATILREFAR